MPKQNPIKNVHVHQVCTKHPRRSAYFWKAESTPGRRFSRVEAWRLSELALPKNPPLV